MKGIGKLLLAILFGMSALTGCGGEEEIGTIQVTFNPNPISRMIPQGQVGTDFTVTAMISPLPSGAIYAYLIDSNSVLGAGSIGVTNNGGGSFTLDLPIKDGLATGTYQGSFTFELCKDAECAQPYALTGGMLSYAFDVVATVSTTATATILIDGVAQTDTGGTVDGSGARSYNVGIGNGHALEIDTSIAISSWSYASPVPLSNIVISPVTTQNTFRATASLISSSDASETATLYTFSADGEAFIIYVTVAQ